MSKTVEALKHEARMERLRGLDMYDRGRVLAYLAGLAPDALDEALDFVEEN